MGLKKFQLLALVFLSFSTLTGFVQPNFSNLDNNQKLNICVDNSDWIPFIYREENELHGVHISIAKKTFQHLNIPYSFHLVPWKRCLKGLEKGSYDGVLSASYNSERANYLHYPADAKIDLHSKWRISQVEYVIALPEDSSYVYDGNPLLIPQPVRIPRGFAIAGDLKELGVKVDDSASSDEKNIKRMLRDNSGSVITLPSIIKWYNQQDEFKNKLKFDPTTLHSKSYFFAVSKKGNISKRFAQNIWQQMAIERDEIHSHPMSISESDTQQ